MFSKTSVSDKQIKTRMSLSTGIRVVFRLFVIIDNFSMIRYIYYIYVKGRDNYVVAVNQNYGFHVHYS